MPSSLPMWRAVRTVWAFAEKKSGGIASFYFLPPARILILPTHFRSNKGRTIPLLVEVVRPPHSRQHSHSKTLPIQLLVFSQNRIRLSHLVFLFKQFQKTAIEVLFKTYFVGGTRAAHLLDPSGFILFPLVVHSFYLVVSSAGILSIRSTRESEVKSPTEDPMTILRKSHSVTIFLVVFLECLFVGYFILNRYLCIAEL
ncbi:PREDICTED: uncharacterized protein LOC104596277 [Nelumbo nucifera]|uniref:Uncharacterized protein LOC104596277 n=1 Tax=Nelumbo nucifera TaxID=4432 RepID=A0A1U8A1Z1_NELNU|nr:PREDICTED: uncharacterized protein LOC104596277 [Nelumbo nucifera]